MDLTPTISTLLIQAHASKPIPPTAKLAERLDSFVKEATQIVSSPTGRSNDVTNSIERIYKLPLVVSSGHPPALPLTRDSSSPIARALAEHLDFHVRK